MIQEIDPTQTKRAAAFSLWMHAPMPMITLFKTLDVTPLVRYSRRTGCKFHMLLCWCIGRAASQTEAFYLLPVDQKLIQYDKLAISTVVPTADHAISTCDIPFSTDLSQFQQDYLNLTRRVHDTGEAYNLAEEYMVIGTSALSQYDIDGAVNLYAGFYNNPFLIWGSIKRAFSNVPCCSLFSSITHSWTVFLPHNSSPACNKKFKPFRRLPSYRKALRDNRPFRPSLRAFLLIFKERNRLSSSKIHGGREVPLSWPHTGPPAQCPLGGYHPVPGRTAAHLKSCLPPQWYPPKDRVLPRRKISPLVPVPHRPVPPASKQPFCQPGPAAPPLHARQARPIPFHWGSAHR